MRVNFRNYYTVRKIRSIVKNLLKVRRLLVLEKFLNFPHCEGKNMNQMKSWRLAMAKLGMLRIYIEKLQHVHCLGYVKVHPKETYDKVFEVEMQQIQNSAVRVFTRTHRRAHITPILKSLHWLMITILESVRSTLEKSVHATS